MRRQVSLLVVVGVGLALLVGVVVANFAASSPDALQRAVISSMCQDAPAKQACLAEKEGEPVLLLAPRALAGYANVPLSGLVGVIATFAVGSGLVYLLRSSRRPRRTSDTDGGPGGDAGGGPGGDAGHAGTAV